MAIGADGDSGSLRAGSQDQAAELPQTSTRRSRNVQEKEDTESAGKRPTDLEVELSIFRGALDRAIKVGLLVKTTQQLMTDGITPVLTLQMVDVSKCPRCGMWNPGRKCPICRCDFAQMPQSGEVDP